MGGWYARDIAYGSISLFVALVLKKPLELGTHCQFMSTGILSWQEWLSAEFIASNSQNCKCNLAETDSDGKLTLVINRNVCIVNHHHYTDMGLSVILPMLLTLNRSDNSRHGLMTTGRLWKSTDPIDVCLFVCWWWVIEIYMSQLTCHRKQTGQFRCWPVGEFCKWVKIVSRDRTLNCDWSSSNRGAGLKSSAPRIRIASSKHGKAINFVVL